MFDSVDAAGRPTRHGGSPRGGGFEQGERQPLAVRRQGDDMHSLVIRRRVVDEAGKLDGQVLFEQLPDAGGRRVAGFEVPNHEQAQAGKVVFELPERSRQLSHALVGR